MSYFQLCVNSNEAIETIIINDGVAPRRIRIQADAAG